MGVGDGIWGAGTMDLDAIYATNQRFWNERAAVHLAPGGYDLAPLRSGRGTLGNLVECEFSEVAGSIAGKRIIHLQCHFGLDSLTLAQRGAEVVAIDFSSEAVQAGRRLAEEVGLADRVRFVECNLYDAPAAVGEAGSFDFVFVTWGAIYWLPSIEAWARVVAVFLKPGGRLYLAEAHPCALVFDDVAAGLEGRPGWYAPYFGTDPIDYEDAQDYANPEATLTHTRNFTWLHPLGATVSALTAAGLPLHFLREHDVVPWQMFRCLKADPDGMYRWPDRPWLPLAFSLAADRDSS
jgi:SAM-dependent methyltransferase